MLEVGGEQGLLALLGGERGPHVGPCARSEVLARRLLDEASVVDDADAVGQVRDLGEDVARHEHGHALFVSERAQKLAHLDDAGGVEPVGGLVEDQHLGRVQQRARQRQTLLVAERELSRPPVRVRLEPQPLDRLGDRIVGRAGEPPLDLEVLAHGEVRVRRRALDEEADPREPALVAIPHSLAEHAHLARSRSDEAEQHADRRGLAGAVPAEKPVDLAAPHVEAERVDGGDVAVALRERARGDDGLGGHRRIPRHVVEPLRPEGATSRKWVVSACRTTRPSTKECIPMQKIATCLWFDTQAEQAAEFYVSLFADSRVKSVSRYVEGAPGPVGSAMTVQFVIEGRDFTALNGGPIFEFTPAISLVVNCDTQAEVDRLWDALTADGGEEGQCGWLTDKFGISWQIIPKVLGELVGSADRAAAQRATMAMLQMVKLDIAALQRAYDGDEQGD